MLGHQTGSASTAAKSAPVPVTLESNNAKGSYYPSVDRYDNETLHYTYRNSCIEEAGHAMKISDKTNEQSAICEILQGLQGQKLETYGGYNVSAGMV